LSRAGRRFVALLAGLVVALSGVEVGVRVFAPQPVAQAPLLRGMLTEPGDHRVQTPEYDVTVHTNSDGFVDGEWGGGAEPPRNAPPEIVVIGDSFVQAAQVAPGLGYGAQLQADLAAAGVETRVRSMGVPGAGTATALGVLDRWALPRHPAVVLLGFLVANDVLNNHPLLEGKDDKPFYTLRNGQLVPVEAADLVTDSPLWRWSAAWRWATRTWTLRQVAERRLALGEGLPLDLRVHDPKCVAGGCPTWEEAWAVTDALIAEMARRCGPETRFGVVLFPDRTQVEGRSDWPAAAGWDFSRAQARAAQVAAAHAPTLDLLPTLKQAGGDLYFPKDGHWTARGHAAAAAGSVEFVRGLLGR
jgi:hypothetical protein